MKAIGSILQMMIADVIKKFWEGLFGLDYHRSICIEQEELGTEKVIKIWNKKYSVKIPTDINKKIILRLKGLGHTGSKKTGDLFLHIWLNKGEDVKKALWLSESAARQGVKKVLLLENQKIEIGIPPGSHNGLVIRLKGLGKELDFNWRLLFRRRQNGNLLVKLITFPDTVLPNYGSFDQLSTGDMHLEGWVYLKIDELFQKIGEESFRVSPIQMDKIADLFNERGWKSIFLHLLVHLKLNDCNVDAYENKEISQPGTCDKVIVTQGNVSVIRYSIYINPHFLDNPFTVAAVLAHELCHVVYLEKISSDKNTSFNWNKNPQQKAAEEKETLEVERTVDLLVFMYKMGEFQLRVARDTRLTLGYFNQVVFERMQKIVSNKMNGH